MIPRLTTGGRSFAGAMRYYLHDKGADTRERVAWTQSVNMLTSDPDKAWKIMAFTAKHQDRLKQASGQKMTGRKTEKPVLAYSLSWHPEQNPDRDHMVDLARRSLNTLGLEDHEALIIAHRDTPHKHVHVVVNRIHPITGLVASDSHYRRRLQDMAAQYQREHGLTYCPQREENAKKREAGIPAPYVEEKIAEAWSVSDDGKSLMAAFEARGLSLAQGRKRLVVVDAYGKVHNPTRHSPGVRAKEFTARLTGVDLDALPNADQLARIRAAQHKASKAAQTGNAPDLTETFNRNGPEKQTQPVPEKPVEVTPPAPATAPTSEIATELPQSKQTAPEISTPASEHPPAKIVKFDPAAPDPVALRLNQLQDRHIRERGELSSFHYRRIRAERDSLSAYYRLDEQRAEIAALEKKCANPSWWRRLFGIARRDRTELRLLKLTHENAVMRFDERIQAMEKRRKEAMIGLETRQQRDWTRELHRLEEHARSHEQRRERGHEHVRTYPRGPSPGRSR